MTREWFRQASGAGGRRFVAIARQGSDDRAPDSMDVGLGGEYGTRYTPDVDGSTAERAGIARIDSIGGSSSASKDAGRSPPDHSSSSPRSVARRTKSAVGSRRSRWVAIAVSSPDGSR